MSDTLARICAEKRDHIARCRREWPLAEVETAAKAATPPRGFQQRLAQVAASGSIGLIAEIKKASPSKGLIRKEFDPPSLARSYVAGGATCLSVLTDQPYFQGRDADLKAARAAVDLPVLRKDFMLDPYQVIEARAIGSDCILLIMAALEGAQAAELEAVAQSLGLDVLVEVHDLDELGRATRLKSRLIGINNRNLKSLKTDLETSIALAPHLPADAVGVAESGFHRPEDIGRLRALGVHCFLVGEALMRQDDLAQATRTLLGLTDAVAPQP